MYSKNKRGPRTDPWGTPQVMSLISEVLLLQNVNCVRPVR